MLDHFAHEHKITICNYYAENESGARLDRPELFRLLKDCQCGDVFLTESVDRLIGVVSVNHRKFRKHELRSSVAFQA
jgi:DNA invertase Pin-like site-specific DNA recombinase